ncbi:hypothetical protein TNCV_204151 [Trichonephila clavipes]|nr:hypothetical protein TNCV_204151 [Trichonephila clavipes]
MGALLPNHTPNYFAWSRNDWHGCIMVQPCFLSKPIQIPFLLLSRRGRANQKPLPSCLIDMEADQTFQVYLIKYQGVHLSDFITFMTQFRIIVNGLQPPEIIDLHTDTEQRIVELLTKVLPHHHHPLDIPRVRAFASFEPKDVSSNYLEQEASKGKGAFIQALLTLYAKSNLYRLAYKAWKRHGPQT